LIDGFDIFYMRIFVFDSSTRSFSNFVSFVFLKWLGCIDSLNL